LADIFYDESSGLYFTRADNGEFIRSTRQDMVTELKTLGCSDAKEKLGVSKIDEALQKIRKGNFVRWSGPLAGYWAGATVMDGQRVLVVDSPRVIQATYGKDDTIWSYFRRLLGDTQAAYLFAWLKVARESFLSQTFRRGPAVILVGEKNHGKSVSGWLIKMMLGGRQADPTQAAQGDTNFNSHLFGREFIFSDDKGGSGHSDYAAQKKTATMIRMLTAEKFPECHGKHKTPVNLGPVFWRVLYALNDESENFKVLPALDRGILDKLMVFKSLTRAINEPTNTDAQFKAFEDKMLGAIPDFLGQLERWKIPASLLTQEDTVDRFGHDVYQNPDVMDEIRGDSPEARLLELIDECKDLYGQKLFVRQIETVLKEHESEPIRRDARRLLDGKASNCGEYLSRLARQDGLDRVECCGRYHGKTKRYLIHAPAKESQE
jgi:hypothetical protein